MTEICVFGAGSIGCYVGGRLQAGGAQVRFVGRPRLQAEVQQYGLQLTDFYGADLHVPAAKLRYDTSPAAATKADMALVTVKSAATADAARQLAGVLRRGAVVLSLQNGIGNDAVLRRLLPNQVVLAGMVPFNVLHRGEGRFHQGSEGDLAAATHAALGPFVPAFEQAGLPLHQYPDLLAVQWAKLLLNLNNPVNALSGVPLKEELSQRAYRRCLAAAQDEALGLLDAAGIRPAKLTPLPARWIPRMMSLPDWVFRRLANKMIAIDPLARSSMWEDLEAGRATEIDWINGELLKLAQQFGRKAPVNARLVALIREAEKGGKRDWSGEELLADLLAQQA